MSRPVPQPPYARASMHFEAWAGHPAVRTGRRLIGRGAPRRVRAPHDTRPLMLRRLVLLAFVILGAVIGTRAMMQILPQHGGTLAEQGLLVLFGVLFGWISAGFWTAAMGAWVLLRRRDLAGAGRADPLLRAVRLDLGRLLDRADGRRGDARGR